MRGARVNSPQSYLCHSKAVTGHRHQLGDAIPRAQTWKTRDFGLVRNEMPLSKAAPKDMNSKRHHNRELTAILTAWATAN